MNYLLLADGVLAVHVGFVLFVILGLVLTLLGGALGWRWVRGIWFRLAHVAAMGIVVAEAWLGIVCPLTRWENDLRAIGGEVGYEGTFVSRWLHAFLYWDAPPLVFTVAYTLFFLLVLLSWFLVRPRRSVDAAGGPTG